MLGLGVSNNGTTPVLIESDGELSDTIGNGLSNLDNEFTYQALRLTEDNWDTEVAFVEEVGLTFTPLTFQDIFGDFSSVSDGDDTINWFSALDGFLLDDERSTDFFGFVGSSLNSNVIGLAAAPDVSASFFSAGSANVVDVPAPVVPLPAGAWLMLTGLGGIAAMRRKRKS